MAKLYKLTNRNYETKNKTKWGEGVSHSGTGKGPLCSVGWIHAYTNPLLAVLLNPIHADVVDPVLWEAEGEISLTDHGLKVGCKTLTTIRVIELPQITTEQRVKFALLCALEVYHEEKFVAWAQDWLSGKGRSAAGGRAPTRRARTPWS